MTSPSDGLTDTPASARSDPPLVSIIVPAFDAEATLPEALESLLAQTFEGWEAIIVDDGSTDATGSVAERYRAQDPRFRVLRQLNNGGPGSTRNVGLREARGRWLLFLDADDWLDEHALEGFLAAAALHPSADAFHAGWVRVLPRGGRMKRRRPIPEDELFAALARTCPFAIHACMVKRHVVEAVGGFDPEFQVCEDHELWLRLVRAGARFAPIDGYWSLYRVRPDSSSMDGRKLLEFGLRVVDLGHAADVRVRAPAPSYAAGRPVAERAAARLMFGAYAAGLEVGRGEDAASMLDDTRFAAASDLDAGELAYTVYEAVCLGRGATPKEWVSFPPEVLQRVGGVLERVESISQVPGVARRARRMIESIALDESDAAARPFTFGGTRAVEIDLDHEVADLEIPGDADRAHCAVRFRGKPLLPVTLPVLDDHLPGPVVLDAVVARNAWGIMGGLLEDTANADLGAWQTTPDTGVGRGDESLGQAPRADGEPVLRGVDAALGWTVFLRELWGLPQASTEHLYDPAAPLPADKAIPGTPTSDGRVTVEVAGPMRDVLVAKGALHVEVVVAGEPFIAFEVSPHDGRVSAQALRSRINVVGGFELCRAVVRALLAVPELPAERLRARLRRAARARAARPRVQAKQIAGAPALPTWADALSAFSGAAEGGTAVGRRATSTPGTASSRLAALPLGASAAVLEAAFTAGEPVLSFGDDPQRRLLYLPGVQYEEAHSSNGLPDVATSTVRPPPTLGRHFFESLFARGPDPWSYETAYERAKYAQTLELLPRRVDRALEVGCAEGHFTLQLAPRVGTLLALDISAIALERARERCRSAPNVAFATLDLFAEDIPGTFELIVCSEVLYYAGDGETLAPTLRRLVDALEPGGTLVTAHAHVLVDEPQEPGFAWDFPFGAQTIERSLLDTGRLVLQREIRTPMYRVQAYKRLREGRADTRLARRPRRVERRAPESLTPRIERDFRPRGGDPPHAAAEPSGPLTRRLPILMYHRVADDGSPELARWRVTPSQFEEQIRFLAQSGFRSISLTEWSDAVLRRQPLPGRAIALTFDDGYCDLLDVVAPLLERYGFRATVFLVTEHVGGTSDWEIAGRAPLLDWDAVRALRRRGFEFGSHTSSHARLASIGNDEVVREASRSRARLQRELGEPVTALAYPHGDVDDAVAHLVGASGYEFGLTCRSGTAGFDDDLLQLPRIEVRGSSSLADLARSLPVV